MLTKKDFVLKVSHYKILYTIMLLNDKHYYPLPEGVGKILMGKKDEETAPFVDFQTFSTLLSFSSKKVCRYVLMLFRYQYLTKIFDRSTNELYLRITEKGRTAVQDFVKKHPSSFKKKELVIKPTIVKID